MTCDESEMDSHYASTISTLVSINSFGIKAGKYAMIVEAIAKGVETNAKARMTEDCKNGMARFLDKH